MEDYSQELEELIALHNANEYEKASKKAQALLDKYPNVQDVYHCCWDILVHAGQKIENVELIKKVIDNAEKKLDNLDYLTKLKFYLLLSDGYFFLYSKTQLQIDREKIILKCKKYCQNIILYREKIEFEYLCAAITNYTFCLMNEGRIIEVIDYYYDVLLDQQGYTVVMCNLGITFFNLASSYFPEKNDERDFIYYESYNFLQKARNVNEDSWIDSLISNSLMKVENHLKSNETIDFYEFLRSMNLLELYSVQQELQKLWQLSPYLRFIKEQRLLLTINPKVLYNKEQYKDNLSLPNVITKNIYQEKNKALCYCFNQIKEEFSTARHLYYQSYSQDQEVIEVSQITEYIDTLDSAYFGLRSGLLKISLSSLVNLLDKCAVFLNLYLELGHDENKRNMNWNNVWYDNLKHKQDTYHTKIQKRITTNIYLKALLYLQKDLYIDRKKSETTEFFYPFKKLRDNIIHKYLILHKTDFFDESQSNYSLEKITMDTYLALRVIKAAIIYLVGVVMIEEKRKSSNT